jgi:hypothetical protein
LGSRCKLTRFANIHTSQNYFVEPREHIRRMPPTLQSSGRRTLADVRAQVAEGVAVRAITKSEVIDGRSITRSELWV